MNLKNVATVALALALASCSNSDPGPLAGKWQMNGPVQMAIQFRSGETESLGIIEKVSYKTSGNDVIVTYESGVMKGEAMRYTMVSRDLAHTQLGDLRRIQ